MVSGSGSGALALAVAIEESGMRLGRDIDIVTKQSTNLVQMFRRELMVVNEDFRLAGRELAKAVLARIGGADPLGLQTLSVPAGVEG
jgi:LacI family transcriptional regulator